MSSGLKRVRATHFFFRLEREHFDKNFVPSNLDEGEKEVFTCVDIKCVHVNVYTKLFPLSLLMKIVN